MPNSSSRSVVGTLLANAVLAFIFLSNPVSGDVAEYQSASSSTDSSWSDSSWSDSSSSHGSSWSWSWSSSQSSSSGSHVKEGGGAHLGASWHMDGWLLLILCVVLGIVTTVFALIVFVQLKHNEKKNRLNPEDEDSVGRGEKYKRMQDL
eukprot:TRINITY_DN174_c0_g1_i1.p1 TRINITY_DN174_c0_g1~~TRINITY_DN174_c0_g1_i1.p1  ORF type:complete len:149 (+),score=28.76 TRINITY_DN174_c0_g1_i1:336-782(+)